MAKYDSCIAAFPTEIDWQKVKTKLKPGSHIAAIAPSLQHHKVTAAMEDAGIEIRDSILFLSTPCYIIALGRVSLEGTVAQNVLKHGVGGINVDECRVGDNPGYKYKADSNGTTFHGQQGERIKQTAAKKGF